MPQHPDTVTTNRPTAETPDQELVQFANRWMEESKPFHSELQKIQEQNERYYKGDQTYRDQVPSDFSNVVLNHIFMAVETAVPIITANPPQFVVEPPEEDEVVADYADRLQRVLGVHYDSKDVRPKGVNLMRHTILYRFGAWKVQWDEEINDVNVKNIRPQRIYLPKYGATVDDIPYIIEKIDLSYDEIEDIFGKKTLKDLLEHRGQEFAEDSNLRGTVTIWEIWTDDVVFWKHGGMILDKRANPYYDFENYDRNHFTYPRKPYIIASIFRLGKSIVGDTDLIQQVIPVQDVINVTTRQIINNANKMGNAQWLVDSEVMTEEEARNKLTNSPGLIIYGSGVANEALMRRDSPPPLPQYIAETKVMAERTFDNIFGTHSTTRGERGQPETLGGRLLLKQADIGRLDLVVREYERCVSELGNWFTQLMRMYYIGERTFRIFGSTGLEQIQFGQELIQRGVRILVKSGTTLPTDEISKRQEAIELWSFGALAPETLFERLKFPDPRQEAERLLAWKQGQLELEAQAQASAGQGPSGPAGRETQLPIKPNQELREGRQRATGTF